MKSRWRTERGPVRRLAGRALAALGGAALLAGCQSAPSDSALLPLVAGPEGVSVWEPACAGLYNGMTASARLAGQPLSSVTLCTVDHPKGVAPGETISLDEVAPPARLVTVHAEHSPRALAALAELLEAPDAERPANLVCTAELRPGVDFTVVTDSGETLAPRIPLDECGRISARVQEVLIGLAHGRY